MTIMRLPRRAGRLTAVFIAFLLIPPAVHLAAEPPGKTPNWRALERGQIIVDQVKNDRGTTGLRCYLLVDGNRDRIFDKLKNPAFFKASYSNIEKLKILHRYKNGAEIEYVLNAIITRLHYIVSRRYDRATYTVWWTKVSGDLKDIQGSWRLEPSPYNGQYLLIYQSFVDPGVVASGFYLLFAKAQAQSKLKKLRTLLEK